METVRGALGLLTRLPIGTVGTDSPGAAAFALVGAVVGAVGAVPLILLGGPAGEPVLGAIAAVGTIAIVTGALHLDGLADTADALLAPDTTAAERARTDPNLGAGGVIVLVLALGAEIAALVSIVSTDGAVFAGSAFVALTAMSRVVPVVAVQALPARAAPHGLGSWFGASVTRADTVVAAGTAALVLAAASAVGGAGWTLVVTVLLALAIGLAAAAGITRKRGALDGDGMGATIEIAIVAGLVATAVLTV
jgi:adenosylcobinamide-GDP ribazoletransferase